MVTIPNPIKNKDNVFCFFFSSRDGNIGFGFFFLSITMPIINPIIMPNTGPYTILPSNKLPRGRAIGVLNGVCSANIFVSDPKGRGIKPHLIKPIGIPTGKPMAIPNPIKCPFLYLFSTL